MSTDSPSEEREITEQYDKITQKSEQFSKTIDYPVTSNLVENIEKRKDDKLNFKRKVVNQFKETRIICHAKVKQLILDFLDLKVKLEAKAEKSDEEESSDWRTFYTTNFSSDKPAQERVNNFLRRLLEKRPLYFFTSRDSTLTRHQETPPSGNWKHVGTAKETAPLVISEYLTYDEMAISALIGVSSPTLFINSGSRNNCGQEEDSGFIEEGVYVGLVGARFEQPELMESKHMKITREYHTVNKGYGLTVEPSPVQKLWAQFYNNTPNFMNFDEADHYFNNGNPGEVLSKVQKYYSSQSFYFNIIVFKARIRISLEIFLDDAEDRAKSANQNKTGSETIITAYAHLVGLGLGVWQVTDEQGLWFVQVVRDIINEKDYQFISDIDFSWFQDQHLNKVFQDRDSEKFGKLKNITILGTRNDPAQDTPEKEGKILVACYAWDSNSFPGNEYWGGMLAASGDPAAACCSTISQVQNYYVNPYLQEDNNIKWFGVDFQPPRPNPPPPTPDTTTTTTAATTTTTTTTTTDTSATTSTSTTTHSTTMVIDTVDSTTTTSPDSVSTPAPAHPTPATTPAPDATTTSEATTPATTTPPPPTTTEDKMEDVAIIYDQDKNPKKEEKPEVQSKNPDTTTIMEGEKENHVHDEHHQVPMAIEPGSPAAVTQGTASSVQPSPQTTTTTTDSMVLDKNDQQTQ